MERSTSNPLLEALPVSVWVLDISSVAIALRSWREAGMEDVAAYVAENPTIIDALRREVKVVERNAVARKMVAADQRVVGNDKSAFPEDGEPGFDGLVVAIAEKRQTFNSALCLRTLAGETIPVVLTIAIGDGRTTLVPATLTDRRERMRLEADAERTQAELDATMQAARLGELAASIAHEINQPLSAISGYASAARRWLRRSTPDIAEAEAAVGEVIRASARASDVVASIRALFGRTERPRAAFVVDAVVADAIESAAAQAQALATTIALDLRAPGASIVGDRVLLQQAIGNLLGNAMQATEGQADGKVLVQTRVEGEGLSLSVQDNGPGFSCEAAERAFQGFFTTKPAGMGLGLSITRSAVESHGGSIAISCSDQLGGAMVTISLPLDHGSVQRSEHSL